MVTEVIGLVTEAMRKRLSLLHLHETLTVPHAHGLIVGKLPVAGDGNRGSRNGKVAAEGSGEATHLAALLAIGTAELRLSKRLGNGHNPRRRGDCEILKQSSAGEGSAEETLS